MMQLKASLCGGRGIDEAGAAGQTPWQDRVCRTNSLATKDAWLPMGCSRNRGGGGGGGGGGGKGGEKKL